MDQGLDKIKQLTEELEQLLELDMAQSFKDEITQRRDRETAKIQSEVDAYSKGAEQYPDDGFYNIL